MKSAGWYCSLLALLACATAGVAQECLNASGESHHKILFENKDIRVLSLQLGRLESTAPFCYAYPFMLVSTSEAQTSTAIDGGPSSSHIWRPGEVLLMSPVRQTVVQNAGMIPYRAVVIETKHTILPVLAQDGTAVTPTVVAPEVSDTDPNWTAPFALGSLSGSRARLAPGSIYDLNALDHALIALNDLQLEMGDGTAFTMLTGEVRILRPGKAIKLVNTGTSLARFVSIEF